MTAFSGDGAAASPAAADAPRDFIRAAVDEDLASGRCQAVRTRFPPEPNGYLHIGHAKAMLFNHGLAQSYSGRFHFRFDDTNPAKEETEYVESIMADARWLGVEWGRHLYFASDYFERLYELAEKLIRGGYAYVDSLTADEIKEYRGTAAGKTSGQTPPGRESPYRGRSPEESLDLFRRMRAGEFPDGAHVLRARIDMAHPNLNMRDPVMYRISRARHHRTGTQWLIYPMYDFAHPLSDAFEEITHSCCSLEYEHHRPLYDWFIEKAGVFRSRQLEFARLRLTRTVLSKRWLLQLVDEKRVDGWDDPRMPTLSGLRRRGYTPEAIREFCRRIGVAKADSVVDIQLLEHCLREHMNRVGVRRMAVLRPIKLVLENYPEGRVEWLEAVNNPGDSSAGTRRIPFSRELWIERDDFMEIPDKGFFRLSPGREVRLRYAYLIRATTALRDASGAIAEIRATYDPATRGGDAPDGRKIKGTLHWISAAHARPAEIRLYDHLFAVETPHDAAPGKTFLDNLNPHSLEILPDARIEPDLAAARPGDRFQFERQGYFCADPDGTPERPVFNRTAGLKDSYAKTKG